MLTIHFLSSPFGGSSLPVLKKDGMRVGHIRALELIEPANVAEACLLVTKLHVVVSHGDEEAWEELDRWERGRIVRLEK
jgi:hypothetical protein